MPFTLVDEKAPAEPAKAKPKAKFTLLEAYDPTRGFVDTTRAGAGKALSDTKLGMEQQADELPGRLPMTMLPVKVAMELGNKVRRAITGRSPEDVQAEIDEARRLDKPLMDRTAGKVGNIGGNVAIALPSLLAGNTYPAAAATGGALSYLQPTGEGESRPLNTAVGTAAGVGGKFVGDKLGALVSRWLASRTAQASEQQAQNAPRDAVLETARNAGLTVPPSQANPTIVNKTLEGFSGKVQTAQRASAENAPVINRIIAKDLGLDAEQPITREALLALRKEAGQAYENVAKGSYASDPIFERRMGEIVRANRNMAEQIPELADKEVLALERSLRKPEFEGRTLVDALGRIREKADAAFRSGDGAAGRIYKRMGSEIEDLIERNLLAKDAASATIKKAGGVESTEVGAQLQAMREARKTIAKSYAAENALEGSNINAARYAQALKKGKPLTGGARDVAEFATEFPKATQLPQRIGSQPGISPLDAVAAMLTGDFRGLAWLTGRPAMRGMLLSDFYQGLMTKPSYGPGAAAKAAALLANPTTQRVLPAAASAAAASSAQ